MDKLKTLKDLDVASGSAWLIRQEANNFIKLFKNRKCKECRCFKKGECWINGEYQSKVEENWYMPHCFYPKWSKKPLSDFEVSDAFKLFFNLTGKEVKKNEKSD